jgi:hypothetical protein
MRRRAAPLAETRPATRRTSPRAERATAEATPPETSRRVRPTPFSPEATPVVTEPRPVEPPAPAVPAALELRPAAPAERRVPLRRRR